MTKIVYAPHCARCGALINEEVVYGDITIKDKSLGKLYLRSIEISPYRCKNCGEIFDRIEIKAPRRIVNEDY